jgi:DNA-directed RNA polymerase subunit alpha
MNTPTDAMLSADRELRDPQAAQRHFADGRAAEEAGSRLDAIDAFRRSYQADPGVEETCFRLAYNLDLVGEDVEALMLYEQACHPGPAKVNALINLAIMYEDLGRYAEAEKCLRQVVDTDPNHARARLFLRDVQASRQMFYDEEQQRQREKQSSLLETPVSDFELSVRARNCLKKMNIRTLGDLLRTTEAELLGYKNFGETSLQEIKAMLAQKGLHLGQALESQASAVREEVYEQLKASGNEHLLTTPVAELSLSVRARKALSLLNIHSIGELIGHTEAELLGIKNFGTTSLEEIKEQLEAQGLSLRKLEE